MFWVCSGWVVYASASIGSSEKSMHSGFRLRASRVLFRGVKV